MLNTPVEERDRHVAETVTKLRMIMHGAVEMGGGDIGPDAGGKKRAP